MPNPEFAKQITDAIGAHGAWKLRLRTAIKMGTSDITASVAGCDNQCAFGKWLHGPGIDSGTRAGVPWKVIQRLHAEFHQSAGSVLEKVVQRDLAQAQVIMDSEFSQRSEKLVQALTKWKREVS